MPRTEGEAQNDGSDLDEGAQNEGAQDDGPQDDGGDLDSVADGLYALPPEDFVPAREDAVAAARDRGARELARAIARLRRPTRAAWLANLLARYRAEQLDGLVALATGLAQAQRTLDGAALRELTSQRHRAVAAMAREAGRLAQAAGSPATEGQLRELHGILDAALAQPHVADELRAGRLTRTLRYTGFGPESDPSAVPAPRPASPPATSPSSARPDPALGALTGDDQTAAEHAAAERAAERAERQRVATEAREDADAARVEQQTAEAAHADAQHRHTIAREQVAALTAELAAARDEEQAAANVTRSAAATARESSRAATAAAARAEQAQARLDELT